MLTIPDDPFGRLCRTPPGPTVETLVRGLFVGVSSMLTALGVVVAVLLLVFWVVKGQA